MVGHACHLPGCGAGCPPRHLFCAKHWQMVPRDLQSEVYRTARLRGPYVDESWAPWWRAQARATTVVLRRVSPEHESKIVALEAKAMAFAEKVESRGKNGKR